MLLDRRRFMMSAAAAAIALSAGLAPAYAQADYPSQTVYFITGFPAGSGADVLVRYLGKAFAEESGQTVVVENKAGAAGNIGAEYLARSKPDGYTIYIHAASSIAANMHLFRNPPVDVGKQIQIAATINQQAFMLIVPAASPYKTVEELVKGMKEKGDKGTYAQSNTTGRVMGKMFTDQAGLETVEVAYKTDIDIVNDFGSGVLDFAMMNPVFALAQQRAGNARVLAVATPERVKSAPEYPTFGEAGLPDLIMLSWFAAMVPAGTPRPVVDKINGYFKTILSKPETVKFLNENGGDPFISTPDEGQKLLLQQIEDWKGYVATAGIEPQ